MFLVASSDPPEAADRDGANPVRPLVASVLVLTLTACGSDTEPAVDRVVEDSAGVRIVTLAGTPDMEAPFAFPPEPLYRHGTAADDYMFSSVRRGILLGDGSAAVFDARNSELVLLNPDGTFHSVLAPAGEGPGEVKMVTSMFAVGRDSILVEDFFNARLTLFAGGAVARTVSTRGPINDGLSSRGMDASGAMLMSSGSYRRGFPDEWLPGHMVRFDLDTGVADTVATYDYVPFRPPEGTPEVPELFPELRGLIDEGRRQGRRTGRFLILGSASVDLLMQAGESLAGRIEFVSLRPFDDHASHLVEETVHEAARLPDSRLYDFDVSVHTCLVFHGNSSPSSHLGDLAIYRHVCDESP